MDSVCSPRDTSNLLSIFAVALILLALPIGSPLIGPIHHGLVVEILEAGGGEEEARLPYLKVSLSPKPVAAEG